MEERSLPPAVDAWLALVEERAGKLERSRVDLVLPVVRFVRLLLLQLVLWMDEKPAPLLGQALTQTAANARALANHIKRHSHSRAVPVRRAAVTAPKTKAGQRLAARVMSPDEFAEIVIRAAAAVADDEFPDRAWISDVWEAARIDLGGGTYEVFRRHLLDAHLRGRLRLSRADLIAALPQFKVRESTLMDGENAYHHVRIPAARRKPARRDSAPLETFARSVLATAAHVPPWKQGSTKRYISTVWRVLSPGTDYADDLPGFKVRLVQANQQGLLTLARADLPEAMNREELRRSHIHHNGADVHFINTFTKAANEPLATESQRQESLTSFAQAVNDLAIGAKEGRWIGDKVWIEQVWREYTPRRVMPLDAFKARLVEAARAGLILLSRADLVAAHPSKKLRESAISVGGEVYHFVETQHLTRVAETENSLPARIRAAWLRAGGDANTYVRLALLRAELPNEPREDVDAELRAMQGRGECILYPIDAPQRLQPEDNAAAMRVGGERRDLVHFRHLGGVG